MSQHPRKHIPLGANNFLSVLEGIEGGFAVFVGIIAGLYFQNISHDLLVASGLIGLTVSAFNTSAVRYASEHYIDELDGREKRDKLRNYFVPAAVEFLTYAFVSLIAVIPLLLIRDSGIGILLTIAITLIILFTAGSYRGNLLGRHAMRDGMELVSIGVCIIIIGGVAGWLLSYLVQ